MEKITDSSLQNIIKFFGSKYTTEQICTIMINGSVTHLFNELDGFSGDPSNFLNDKDWFNKWPHWA